MPVVNCTFPKGFYIVNVLEVKINQYIHKAYDLGLLFLPPDQASGLVVGEKKLMPLVPEEAPASETDINLEVSFAEQAVNQKESSKDRTQKSKCNDVPLLVRIYYSDVTKQSLLLISLLF